ncbi:hypothetical protein HDU99_001505 [Rhizoclosmatium hyalinum]|nr:hypothetical protein HDU99_001505 [Rhizoclosmatium hyalinum]
MECFSLQPSAAAFSAAAPPTSVFVDATSSLPICEFGFGVLRSADGFAAFVPEQRRGHPIKSARRSHVRSPTSYLLVVCGDAAVQVLLLRETLATASNSLIFEASHELRLLRNKRHAILGAEWSPFTEDSEFFVVSTDSIDFYSMSRSKKVFMLRRSIPISVTWFQYSQKHSVIAIYSSNAPHCVSILYIGGRRGAVIELAPVNLVSPAPDFGKNGLISGIGSSLSRILLGGDNGNVPATNPFEISRNEVFILQV